ncbi:hypothetical protein F1559_004765 [Cyanidiococcus yangmingshanensis]|uniref:Uncharacterized protein n=1 Tax=Cyanidiococcus yangmingshanensis TaxID=2690220 RepID=A0A7J7IRL0_9RHOD|nr:hypothetical protein F1559_004765 [Cyanidiococcus yangmingshanensis]
MGAGDSAASGLLSSAEPNRSIEQERQREEHAFQRRRTGGARSPQRRPRREGGRSRSSSSHAAASISFYLLEKLGLFACSFRIQVSRLSASISVPRTDADTTSELSASASRWNTFRVQWENLTLSSPTDEAEVLTFLQSIPYDERIPSREQLTEWFGTDGTVCKCLSWEVFELTCNDVSLISPVQLKLILVFNIYTTNPIWVWFQMTPLRIDIVPSLTELASLWLPLVGHGAPEQPTDENEREHVADDPVDTDSDILVPFWKALVRGRVRIACYGVLEQLQISVGCLRNLPSAANLDVPLQSVLQLRPLHLSIQYGWDIPLLAQMQCLALELTLSAVKETNEGSLSVNGHASASSEQVALVRLAMDRTEKQSSALDVRWTLIESMAERDAPEHTPVSHSWWPWSRTKARNTRSSGSKRYTTDPQIGRTLYCSIGMLNIGLKDCLISSLNIRQESDSASESVPCSVSRLAAEMPPERSTVQSATNTDLRTARTGTAPSISDSFLLHVERFQLALEDTTPKILVAVLGNLCVHVDHRPLAFASDSSCYDADLERHPIMTRSWQVYRVHTAEEQEAEHSTSDRSIEQAVWLSGLHIQQAHCAWVPSTVSETLDAIRDYRTEQLIQLNDPLVLTIWRQVPAKESWSALWNVVQTTDRPVIVASSVSLRVSVPAFAAFWTGRFSSYQRDSRVQVSPGKDDGTVEQRNETALDWPLRHMKCTWFQIVLDWDGLGTDTTSGLVFHGRRIQLRPLPASITETIPSMMQLEADALVVSIAGQARPLLQCLGLAAQLPSSIETWTRTPSAPMNEIRVTEPIRVQLVRLESVLSDDCDNQPTPTSTPAMDQFVSVVGGSERCCRLEGYREDCLWIVVAERRSSELRHRLAHIARRDRLCS